MSDTPMMPKNLATWDRALRVVAGVLLLAVWGLRGFAGWWMPLLGVALLVNAAMGSCGLYKMLGVSTCPIKLKAPVNSAPGEPGASPQ